MFRTYFQKEAIKKVFRTAKGPLSLGPLRYRRKDRIEAYATVVYLAHILWSWAERKLRVKYPERTLEEAFHTLGEVTWIRFGRGNRFGIRLRGRPPNRRNCSGLSERRTTCLSRKRSDT